MVIVDFSPSEALLILDYLSASLVPLLHFGLSILNTELNKICCFIVLCFATNYAAVFYFIVLAFAALLVENGKFLLSAKRNRRTTCTEYVISMDADNISRSSSTYIGKLR